MRRIVATLTTVILLGLLAVPAAVAHTDSGSSARLVAHPGTTTAAFGVSEFTAPCSPGATTDGIDGDWWNITDFGDGSHDLTVTPSVALDVDVHFYTEQCNFLDNDFECAQGFLGATETCRIPNHAGYMIVNGWAGAGSYSYSIS